MQVRGHLRVKARSDVKHNSGTLDNGNPWQNWTFEAVDEDDNKVVVRVEQAATVKVGSFYDVVADVEGQAAGRLRITAASIREATAAAKAS